MSMDLQVRHVAGRYPHAPARFDGENIITTVTEVARVYTIRVDDAENPDMWLEIVVEVETGGEPCAIHEPRTASQSA